MVIREDEKKKSLVQQMQLMMLAQELYLRGVIVALMLMIIGQKILNLHGR